MNQEQWHKWLWQPWGEALQLSFFVLVIMTLMEYAALKTPTARWRTRAEGRSGWQSVCMGALLGWVPGCVGGFAAVSFYTHGFWRFGAVLAASVTALGDDAFRMWGLMPGKTFEISLLLTVVGIALGLLFNRVPAVSRWKTRSYEHCQTHEEDLALAKPSAHTPEHTHRHADTDAHAHAEAHRHNHAEAHDHNSRSALYIRLLFIALSLWYLINLFGGLFEGLHLDAPGGFGLNSEPCTGGHAHNHHGHVHSGHIGEWLFENGLFILLGVAALVVLCRAKAHFIRQHLWEHVVKEHFASIFLWTVGTLYALLLWETLAPVSAGDTSLSPVFWLLLAIGIGWIPYSGPHFLFIKLYADGTLPLGVLMANAFVQDGHASLVLLSESRRQFVRLKSIKSLVAILIGLCGLWWGV